MKRFTTVSAILALSIAITIVFLASQRVWSYSQLESACQEKTRDILVASGDTPTDWMPTLRSTLESPLGGSDQMLNQYGKWRVGQRHVDVLCSSKARGLKKDIRWEIGQPQ